MPTFFLLVASFAFVAVPARAEVCGSTSTVCPADGGGCCASAYSPSKYGCLVEVGDLATKNAGCGDILAVDNTTHQLCCKMGPATPPSSTLPNVLVVGDSVSIGYTTLASPNLVSQLSSVAAVQHGPWDVSDGGAGSVAVGLACLDRWLVTQANQAVQWDLITFNFGLHDLTNGSHCLGLYREQLTNVTARLASLGTKLMYITTTPYMPLRLQGNTVVEDMNAIAREVVGVHKNVAVTDLYTNVTGHCGSIYTDCDICRMSPCSFHYNALGMTQQAEVVATAIKAQLGL